MQSGRGSVVSPGKGSSKRAEYVKYVNYNDSFIQQQNLLSLPKKKLQRQSATTHVAAS